MNQVINYLRSTSMPDAEALTERLNDFFPGLIYIYDLDSGRLRHINKGVNIILGYTEHDLENTVDPWSLLIREEDFELVANQIAKIRNAKAMDSLTFHCRSNHKDGHCLYFRTKCTVLQRDEFGNPLSVLFLASDITDQIKAEEENDAMIRLFKETEDLLQFGSWSWDISSDKLEWTKGMFSLMECHPDQHGSVNMKFYKSFMAEEDHLKFDSLLTTALKEKDGFEYEFFMVTRSGKQKAVLCKAKVVTDQVGNAKKVLGINRDITALKNLEKEGERTMRELKRSNKELEEFAYVASHDLQEPLRKISTFNERLRSRLGDSLGMDASMYIDRIIASTDNMKMLIDNLLEFSRITRSSHVYTRCDLDAVIKEVLSDQELKIEETNTAFQISALPVIEAVSLEMKQLFNNLISNAIKFRKRDSSSLIQIKSDVLEKAEKDKFHLPWERVYYKIQVIDNGIGFEEEYAERIFQIFQRLHGKAEYAGSGIGLAICKKIADNHDGLIFAESKLGQGSIFSIVLPEKQLA